MRCGFVKRATWLLGLLVPATMAADYYIKATYDNNRATYIAVETTRGTQCRNIQNGLAFSTDDITQEDFAIYKSSPCQERNLIATISGAELYAESDSAIINIDRNGNWNFTNKPKDDPEEGPKDDPKDPEDPRDPGQDDPKDPEDPGKDTPKNGLKFIAFFTPWTNTNAKVYLSNGDSAAMVPVEEKYCGWFIAGVRAPESGFSVYFKQTIGPNFVGAEGLTKTEPTSATEISLDSVAALTDTIWVKGNQEGAPAIYSEHPAGVLGDCPIKKLPVMMFDWLHGSKGDGERGNGNPENGISADFGSGGCSGNPMRGMVATELGPNGVPVSAANFPTNCKITEHLDYWFLPESLAVDAQGNTLTNMTCRDLYISMDDEGFWLAEVSKDAISKGNEANQGGMFLLDDFQYLDEETKTIPNPYYDQLRGGSDNRNHNFGFTMKIQATFEYVPGQYFDFLGDDDVWVFINNKLVVDIGGQHAQVAGAVDLDTLGLIPDSTYNFHIFYAERHTSSSNFRMHTSIDLKTEASILLRSPSSNSDVIEREIYQRIRKNKLSCDFSEADKELTLERGASTFTLFGGNLPSTGIELDSAGLWFGGITIGKDFDVFKIDKEAIKDAHGLAPGVYYLRVSLVADNSQHKDVYFVVGAYELPNLTFTDPKGNFLGAEIVSDTLQLNLTKDVTMWVGQSYKVYVQYADSWAMNSNDMIYPSTNDPALIPCDSLGNPITEVQLVNGAATFYVKAVGELWGGILYVKGQASGNTAIWSSINFALPPVPQIQYAYMFDRDGDGRGDSIWVHFNGTLGGKNSLDSAKFTFGSVFDKAYTANYDVGDSVATIVADGNGFGTSIFTGGEEKAYTGQLKVWYTYKDNGKTSVFPTEGQLEDRIGPVIMAAEVAYMKDGNTQLTISFSEALQDNNASSDMFNFHVWKNGIMSTDAKQASDISTSSATQWKLIFPKGADTDIIPAVGDSVRFATSTISTVLDLINNRPHQDNPWVRITGEQKVTITSPGVVTLEPGSAVFDSAKAIIQSPEATVAKIIQDPSILTAEQAAAAYGTQGHFLGDLNMAELVENEIADIVRAVQSTPSYVDKDEAEEAEKNGTTPRSYSIEDIIAMVDNGDMSINEAKKRFDLDPVIVEAYENGILDSRNIDKFQRGTEADIKQIVEAVAENTELRYKSTYYSSLGEFVNSNSDVITCNSDIFKENGQGTCLDNNGKLFLAWNMRAKNGRLASTGVYIARLEYRIKVGSKTVVNRTQDFLWGVRRGKVNALDLGL